MAEAYRVRIIHTNGNISVVDKAFSQTVEMLRGVNDADRETFWDMVDSINLPNGENVKLARIV